MKILLVNPPRVYYHGSKAIKVGLPLGLMYMASYLEKNGYEPKILDCLIHPEAKISKIGKLVRHGLPENKIVEIIRQEMPDIIGIGNNFTAQIDNVVKIADLAKQINPKIVTVTGGNHVTIRGLEFLEQNPNIDIGVCGEGEEVFLSLIKRLENKEDISEVKSIFYRDSSGRVKQNDFGGYIKNLDELPYPAYHLIDMDYYFDLQDRGLATRSTLARRSISLVTSRGCPYDCVFCSIHLHMGRLWRAHSADYVLRHIKFVVEKYGIKHISFEDDNLTLNLDRAKVIFRGLIENNIKISWDTPNGVRADRLDEELAKLMKKSGCVELVFGIESGDQGILEKVIKKNLNLSDVVKSVALCHRFKIKLGAPFVIGFPGEKIANIKKSMDFAWKLKKEYNLKPGFLIATPLIGTELYNICKEKNFLVKEPDPAALSIATQVSGRGLIKTDDFTPQDLKKMALSFQRKIALLDLWRKFKYPGAVFKSLKFFLSHPLKSFDYIKKTINH